MTDLATLRKETHAAVCLACGKCSTMCPLSPSGWFSAARMVAIRDPESEVSGQSQSLNACLTCGACEIRCPEGVRFIDFVRGVRHLAPAGERHPCPHGEMLQSAARLMSGPKAPTRNLDWLTDDLVTAEEGEVALFVGCLSLYDALFSRELGLETVEIARAAVRLLNRAGIAPVVLGEERCCGHDLLWNGEREAFAALADANAASFAKRGIKHILTTCAECCRTWRIDYAEHNPSYRPKVEHLSEFVADRIESGELVAGGPNGHRITFQDPCRLGRHLGVTDAPRQVIAEVTRGTADGPDPDSFIEMPRAGRDAVCCGTSGFIHCDANSRRLQSERLASAEATGADVLATACPKCLIHFACALSEDQRRGRREAALSVKDLTVLAAEVLQSGDQTSTPQSIQEETPTPATGEA